jgi:hypothetical protein
MMRGRTGFTSFWPVPEECHKVVKVILSSCIVLFIMISRAFPGITFGDEIVIKESVTDGASSVAGCDIDNDGDMDVLCASYNDNTVGWFENLDGAGNFSRLRIITNDADSVVSAFACDLDNDGNMDVISAAAGDNTVAWYRNRDGLGTFSGEKVISTTCLNMNRVFAADIDGDNDKDVFYSPTWRGGKIGWFENTDGNGTFSDYQIMDSVNNASEVHLSDLDGDGDQDIIAYLPDSEKLVWYENLDGQGSFGPHTVIDTSWEGSRITSADIDGDGDNDVLFGDCCSIVLYRNMDGNGYFNGVGEAISGNLGLYHNYGIIAADADNDGDLDVFYGEVYYWGTIGWLENRNGFGSFDGYSTITSNVARLECFDVCDINGDNYVDVISATSSGDKIAWYGNRGGSWTSGEENDISDNVSWINSLYFSDINNDGFDDILTASGGDDKVLWFENNGGTGQLIQHTITNTLNNVDVAVAYDVDNDGDRDVLANYYSESGPVTGAELYWYRNTDGKGSFTGAADLRDFHYHFYNS